MTRSPNKLIPSTFSPAPSLSPDAAVGIVVHAELPVGVDACGYAVGVDGAIPDALGVDRAVLEQSGFEGRIGQTLVLPQSDGPVVVAVGVGDRTEQDAATLRNAAASFARSTSKFSRLALSLGDEFAIDAAEIGRAIAEGVLLARYRYTALQATQKDARLESLDIIVPDGSVADVSAGVRHGEHVARAANLARDLANTPPGYLTATDLGDFAAETGPDHDLEVEVSDLQQLIELGCGGLLGVNAGSTEEPRMIVLRYRPDGASGHLALVGKGITYDSGGISLKPSDPMHLAMKMDMAGAGAVLAAMTALSDLGCTTAVTAYLMCTDNMPSGSATKLGDVLTIRGGTTVEVKNTDAEGRLVMADALVLAREESPDAIVDIATLTGASLAALGHLTAALFGTDDGLVGQLQAAAIVTDESVWELPLERRYREQLDSDVADMSNMGGKWAGATIAALFLADFVGEVPWAHLDIAGTMQSEKDDFWRSKGATGFGTRLLIELALNFRAP
ncbi:leucyl aminopeptidase [Mycetocola sp. CAN_C7]|uniref:leucyl aminopeptidase n=1 Tax=Mycetocola sp. CAN_C7 TaxID=2787724 RepID=UPI0018C9DFD0